MPLLLLLLLAAPVGGSAPGAAELRALERELCALVNQERKSQGSPPVRLNEALSQVGRAHSRDMRDRRFFAHLTPEGTTPVERVLAARIACSRVGENIAVDRDVIRPHRTMMAEPPGQPNHRTTLLNPRYTDVGIGIEAAGEWLYITEDFVAAGAAQEPEWDGSAYSSAGGLGDALNALHNQMARLHERLGRMALLTGDAKGAAESFQAALRQDPRCAGAHAGLGEANERLGKPDAARGAYAAAVAADPDNADARLRLAVLALAAGRPKDAEPHFRVLTRVQPDSALAWYGAARCAVAGGRADEARAFLRRAVALDAAFREKARAEPSLAPLLE